ncbi:hypothetical protein FRC02_002334 [Tulasnella sp. 418]|nr:hypothetical protein FRC02_002334 [Tulasnella sp. 418]
MLYQIDGTVVPARDVEELEVAVMSVPLSFSPEDLCFKLKEGSRPRHHPEITTDHAGGRKVPE